MAIKIQLSLLFARTLAFGCVMSSIQSILTMIGFLPSVIFQIIIECLDEKMMKPTLEIINAPCNSYPYPKDDIMVEKIKEKIFLVAYINRIFGDMQARITNLTRRIPGAIAPCPEVCAYEISQRLSARAIRLLLLSSTKHEVKRFFCIKSQKKLEFLGRDNNFSVIAFIRRFIKKLESAIPHVTDSKSIYKKAYKFIHACGVTEWSEERKERNWQERDLLLPMQEEWYYRLEAQCQMCVHDREIYFAESEENEKQRKPEPTAEHAALCKKIFSRMRYRDVETGEHVMSKNVTLRSLRIILAALKLGS